MASTKQKLLENFDSEVAQRLNVNYNNSTTYLNKQESMLWAVTRYFLDGWADFEDTGDVKAFTLTGNPFGQWYNPLKQTYYFDKAASKGRRYRLNSPLARRMLKWLRDDVLDNVIYGKGYYKYGEVTFDLTSHLPKISVLEKYKGKRGFLRFYIIKIEGLEDEDILIFTGYTDDGVPVNDSYLKKLFELEAVCHSETVIEPNNPRSMQNAPIDAVEKLDKLFERKKEKALAEIEERNAGYFDAEIDKLDKWAKDVKHSLEKALRQLDTDISAARKQYAKATKLQDKLDAQDAIKTLEARRNELRLNIYTEQDKIDKKRDELIRQARGRLEQRVSKKRMFVVRWRVQ